jgi:hypothetical protein
MNSSPAARAEMLCCVAYKFGPPFRRGLKATVSQSICVRQTDGIKNIEAPAVLSDHVEAYVLQSGPGRELARTREPQLKEEQRDGHRVSCEALFDPCLKRARRRPLGFAGGPAYIAAPIIYFPDRSQGRRDQVG